MKIFEKIFRKVEGSALSDDEVYDLALERLVRAFKIKKEDLRPEMILGRDLNTPPKKLFSMEDTLTDVYDDIDFIASAVFRKDKNFFKLVEIRGDDITVDKFCSYIVQCYRLIPGLVEDVLRSRKLSG